MTIDDNSGSRQQEASAAPGWLSQLLLRLRDSWDRALELHPLWFLVFLVVSTLCLAPGGALFSPSVEIGDIATRDYLAVRDLLVPDHESTTERRARARQTVLPVYDYDSALAAERTQQLTELFESGRARTAHEVEGEPLVDIVGAGELTGGAPSAAGLRLSAEMWEALEAQDYSEQLETRLRQLFQDILLRGVVADKSELLSHRVRGITRRDLASGLDEIQLDVFEYLAYPDEVRESITKQVRGWTDLSSSTRAQFVAFTVDNITPNLLPNRSESLAREDAAEVATGTVVIQVRKGQMIVRQGDQITATAAETIALMSGEGESGAELLPWLGAILMLTLVALVLWLGLKSEHYAGKSRRRVFSETLLLILGAVVGVRFGFFVATALSGSFDIAPFDSFRSYMFAIPFATLAMVAELLYGRVVALMLSLVFALLVGRMAGPAAAAAAVYCIAGSLTGIYTLENTEFRQRSTLTRAGLRIGLANVVVILMLRAVAGESIESPQQLGFDALCGLVGGLICAASASFALPILESLYSITTDIKLVELANTNLPLLRRLAFEAPGSFQHSLMVANLAKNGCEAVQANAVLAHTGGLYHDIGKLARPEYFIENQRPGRNPHDDLPPEASAAILVEHITEGLELARRHHLPKPLCDAIEQHHGGRLMSFFHSRALERGGTVREATYRYPGPRPQNKVMGVLMLADAVEAASRTLVDGRPERIRVMVDKIFEACLVDRQLDETDLTLADIQEVADSFVRLLTNLFHRRIDYPGYEFNDDLDSPESALEGVVDEVPVDPRFAQNDG